MVNDLCDLCRKWEYKIPEDAFELGEGQLLSWWHHRGALSFSAPSSFPHPFCLFPIMCCVCRADAWLL